MRKFIAGGVVLSVVVLLVWTDTISSQNTERTLENRLAQLEQRVASLEAIVLSQPEVAADPVAEGEVRLATVRSRLTRTEKLAKQGFVTAAQLEIDKLAVVNAEQELQYAKEARNDLLRGLEIELLGAEKNLMVAKERLKHTERLRAKGYVNEAEAKADRFEVERAVKQLERVQAKLNVYRQNVNGSE